MVEKECFCFLLLSFFLFFSFLKTTYRSGNLRYSEHMDEGQGVLTILFAGPLSAHCV